MSNTETYRIRARVIANKKNQMPCKEVKNCDAIRSLTRSALRQDLALAHLRLDRSWQNFHRRKPPRHPTHTVIEPARQLIQAVAAALLQLSQQPAHRFHRVPVQLL